MFFFVNYQALNIQTKDQCQVALHIILVIINESVYKLFPNSNNHQLDYEKLGSSESVN